MVVPSLVIKVHEPDTPLDQASGKEAVIRERGLAGLDAVKLQRFLGLAGEVHQFRGAGLHPVGHLILGDAGGDLRVSNVAQVAPIQGADQVEGVSLETAIEAFGAGDIEDRVALGAEDNSLIGRRQKAARPVRRTAADTSAGREDDETGQVGRLAPEPVRHPRPHARSAGERRAGVQEDLGRGVVELIRMQGLDDRDVINDLGQMGKHLRKLGPALAVPRKLVPGRHQARVGPDEGVTLVLHDLGRDRLAVELPEYRLLVEEVELARSTSHEHVNDTFRLRGEVGRAWGERVRGFLGRGGSRDSKSKEARAILPSPTPQSRKKCRRVNAWRRSCWSSWFRSIIGALLLRDGLIEVQDRPADRGQGGQFGDVACSWDFLGSTPEPLSLDVAGTEAGDLTFVEGEDRRKLLIRRRTRQDDFEDALIRASAEGPASSTARPASACAASTKTVSFRSVRAWSGVFERSRRRQVVSEVGASNVTKEAYGAVLLR